jgi:signal transduction histidine kinase
VHQIGLNAEELSALFPFHIVVDNNLSILQIGASVRKLFQLELGVSLFDYFSLYRPDIPFSFASLKEYQNQQIFFKAKNKPMLFRGQVVLLKNEDKLLLLCTPSILSAEELPGLGLKISDFPIHDSTLDFLLIAQTQKNLLKDANSLSNQISTKNKSLEKARAELKNYAETLELKVSKRTNQLESLNKKLQASNEEAQIAKKVAEKANLSKSDFLSRMSHELRTPMNAILGFSQLMELDVKNVLTKKHKENLSYITSAGKHLLELINEVLDLAKIESEGMEVSVERVDIIPITDNVISISKPLAAEKSVSLEYQKIPKGSCFIKADPLRFKQIILNLISNAIKYNKPNGSVIVSFEEQDNDMMRLGIRDTGHGIAEDKKDKLFKPFERFDVNTEHIEGTGIGLTITKKLIELMGGTIGVESTIGEGSFFYIDIPVSIQAYSSQTEDRDEPDKSSLTDYHKKKILYIEDIPANVSLVKQILDSRQEIKLLSAQTAQDGIELAQVEIPDLILMDIHLPEMDGLTAFKKLQTINETKNIPTIALTADAMDGDIKKALNMGFKDYITKPIDVPSFLNTIDEILK